MQRTREGLVPLIIYCTFGIFVIGSYYQTELIITDFILNFSLLYLHLVLCGELHSDFEKNTTQSEHSKRSPEIYKSSRKLLKKP